MNLLRWTKFFFTFSGVVSLVAIAALVIFGLRPGIDFKGGTITELEFRQEYDIATVRQQLVEQGIGNFQAQPSGGNAVLIKTEALEKEKHDQVLEALRSSVGEFEEKRFESIGPVIGQELTRNAFYQLVLVSLGIVLYIAYAFRKVQRPITPIKFGVTAVIALVHDLLVVLGVFAILGHYFGVEVDSMFVTAMLTVLGFSVHDTIVVFDRIRENLKVHAGNSLDFIINHSISQTIVRSLNTSLTVLFVLLALLLFGGETIRYFVLALLIGIAVGTYSSIFVASPLLVAWHRWGARGTKR